MTTQHRVIYLCVSVHTAQTYNFIVQFVQQPRIDAIFSIKHTLALAFFVGVEFYVRKGRSVNRLQNGIILLIFEI